MRSVISIFLFCLMCSVKAQVWGPVGKGLDKTPIAVAQAGKMMAVLQFSHLEKDKKVYQVSLWNTVHWQTLPLLSVDTNQNIRAIHFYKQALYIGGNFTSINDLTNAKYVVRWKDRKYEAVSTISNNMTNAAGVSGFADFDGKLMVHGVFTNTKTALKGTMQFDGNQISTAASNFGDGLNGAVNNIIVGSDQAIYFGGFFSKAGGSESKYFAKYKAGNWTRFGSNKMIPLDFAFNDDDIVFTGITIERNDLGFYTVASNDIEPMNNGISAITTIYDIMDINGVLYASGIFTLDGSDLEQTLITYKNGKWISMKNGDLNGIRLLINYDSHIIATGYFLTKDGILLSRVARYINDAGIVTGHIFFDKNKDCKFNDRDENISSLYLHAMPDNKLIIPDKKGNYVAILSKGKSSLELLSNKLWFVNEDCIKIKPEFTLEAGQVLEELDIPLLQNNGVKDVQITLKSNTGKVVKNNQKAVYQISFKNLGSNNLDFTKIRLEHDKRLVFNQASLATSSKTDSKLEWEIDNLYAGEERIIYLNFELSSQSETPLELTASIDIAEGEVDVEDNSSSLVQTLTTEEYEFRKDVFPSAGGDTAFVSTSTTSIDYQISFANYTADTIRDVYILDTIQLGHNILGIYEIARSHHAVLTGISGEPGTNVGVLVWAFEGINLPPNPTKSPEIVNHTGFVSFRLGIDNGASEGQMLTNQANITFDYFEPENTNKVYTIIDDQKVSVSKLNLHDLNIYPNPAYNQIHLNLSKQIAKGSYRVVSLEGKSLLEGSIPNSRVLDISSLPSGMYYIECEDKTTLFRGKFVKI